MLSSIVNLVNNRTPDSSVNRVTPLINLIKFNVIEGFVPDDMHFARLGIAKQMCNYWFEYSKSTSKSPLISVLSSSDIKQMDTLISNFQVPNLIMRLSRTISDRKFWKAK